MAFAIVTLAISQLLQIGVAWTPVTGGTDGASRCSAPKIFGYSLDSGRSFYLLVAVVLIIVYGALFRLTRSPFGRTLHAIRVSEQRAAAIGIAGSKGALLPCSENKPSW